MTLKNIDIAKTLNLSPAAVSLARNNKAGVSAQTRKLVQDFLSQNSREQSACEGADKAQIVLSVHKKHGHIIAETPFFLSLTEDIQRQANLDGSDVSIMQYNPGDDPAEFIEKLVGNGARGILLLATEMEETDIALYQKTALPVVLIDSHFVGLKMDSVVIGNADAIFQAVQYAYKCGHREIGYLHSRVDNNNFRERYWGYRQAMEMLGIPIHPEYVFHVGSQADHAYEDMSNYLKNGCRLPSLLIAGNDLLAIGSMRALKEAGIRIPDDLSIIGFDDMPISRMMDPPLTSVRIYNKQIGELAVSLLMKKIKNESKRPLNIEVGCDLIKRNSVRTIGLAPDKIPAQNTPADD